MESFQEAYCLSKYIIINKGCKAETVSGAEDDRKLATTVLQIFQKDLQATITILNSEKPKNLQIPMQLHLSTTTTVHRRNHLISCEAAKFGVIKS